MTKTSALVRCALFALTAGACQSSRSTHISGQLVGSQQAALSVASAAAPVARRITHVMAVDPESASPNRVLSRVSTDGHFSLDVNFGHPYVLVFVDGTAVGTDMVVAVFRARTLDTLAALSEGDIALGEVTTKDGVATASVPYDDLLAQMGLSAASAEFLGAIDDLSLRYANPDIDGDGVIDLEQEGHQFQLDFHLRAQMLAGPGGEQLRVSDMTDQFLPQAGERVATPDFNLASIYAIYPAAYDGARYVTDRAALMNGAAFQAMDPDGNMIGGNSSFSPLQFGDRAGWGPDYDWHRSPGTELPGSGGRPVSLRFTLGASGHTLTFPNVITRTRGSLAALGTPVPFVRLVTSAGRITALDFQWMKRGSDGSWLPCTAEELSIVVGDQGGFLGLSHGSKDNRAEIRIPREPAGTVAVSGDIDPREICAMGLSYDDKLGLRLFVGGVEPSLGTPVCY
jgi:hypothetical protein